MSSDEQHELFSFNTVMRPVLPIPFLLPLLAVLPMPFLLPLLQKDLYNKELVRISKLLSNMMYELAAEMVMSALIRLYEMD
jgi:hypothetical protein